MRPQLRIKGERLFICGLQEGFVVLFCFSLKKVLLGVVYKPLISSFNRQSSPDLCRLKATLVYIGSPQTARVTWRDIIIIFPVYVPVCLHIHHECVCRQLRGVKSTVTEVICSYELNRLM